MSETLYPELIDYIYQFCEEFKTADEKLAGKTMLYNPEAITDKILPLIICSDLCSVNFIKILSQPLIIRNDYLYTCY